MAEILKLRNELVHHWMRTRSLMQGTSRTRLAMIEELEAATSQLQDANRILQERTQALMANAGVPDEFIDGEYQRLMGLAERGEDDPEAPEYFSPANDQ